MFASVLNKDFGGSDNPVGKNLNNLTKTTSRYGNKTSNWKPISWLRVTGTRLSSENVCSDNGWLCPTDVSAHNVINNGATRFDASTGYIYMPTVHVSIDDRSTAKPAKVVVIHRWSYMQV